MYRCSTFYIEEVILQVQYTLNRQVQYILYRGVYTVQVQYILSRGGYTVQVQYTLYRGVYTVQVQYILYRGGLYCIGEVHFI